MKVITLSFVQKFYFERYTCFQINLSKYSLKNFLCIFNLSVSLPFDSFYFLRTLVFAITNKIHRSTANRKRWAVAVPDFAYDVLRGSLIMRLESTNPYVHLAWNLIYNALNFFNNDLSCRPLISINCNLIYLLLTDCCRTELRISLFVMWVSSFMNIIECTFRCYLKFVTPYDSLENRGSD